MADSKKLAHEVTLSSGRVIIIREPLQSDMNKAMKMAGAEAGDNNTSYFGVMIQEELLKNLIVSVDGNTPSVGDIENEDFFTLQEGMQLKTYLAGMLGEVGKPPEAKTVMV